eukprot:363417-Chlamydomonas_euryale.AAC.4
MRLHAASRLTCRVDGAAKWWWWWWGGAGSKHPCTCACLDVVVYGQQVDRVGAGRGRGGPRARSVVVRGRWGCRYNIHTYLHIHKPGSIISKEGPAASCMWMAGQASMAVVHGREADLLDEQGESCGHASSRFIRQ